MTTQKRDTAVYHTNIAETIRYT